jgi:hypothetical protein
MLLQAGYFAVMDGYVLFEVTSIAAIVHDTTRFDSHGSSSSAGCSSRTATAVVLRMAAAASTRM